MDIYENILPYVYRVTKLATGEFYIGSRQKNVSLGLTSKDDFLFSYHTSGCLKEELKRTPTKFKAEIIFEFHDYDVCYWYEQLLILENISNPLCLNKTYVHPETGQKKFSTQGMNHSNKTKEKMRLSAKNRIMPPSPKRGSRLPEETRAKISKSLSGKRQSKETIQKRLDSLERTAA